MVILRGFQPSHSQPQNVTSCYEPPDDKKSELFHFEDKWYNMDVSNLSRRPTKETYDWNIKNHWLQRYVASKNTVIFFAFCVLGKFDIKVPSYWNNSFVTQFAPFMVHDTCFDMSHLPEYNLCVEVGMKCRHGFDHKIHGWWMNHVTDKMRIAMEKR